MMGMPPKPDTALEKAIDRKLLEYLKVKPESMSEAEILKLAIEHNKVKKRFTEDGQWGTDLPKET